MSEWRGRLSAQLVRERFVPLNLGADLLAVIVVISEGCVHIRERQTGILGNDLIGAEAAAFVAQNYVLHGDAMAGDSWTASTSIGRNDNMLGRCFQS